MHLGRTLLLLAALAAPCGARSATARPAEAKKIRIAVLDIRALGTDTQKAELLNEIALTEAATIANGFEVIGKSDINAVIGFEKQKQVMGCGDDSTCLAEIGGALGVDYILVGSLGAMGALFRLDLKLVDAKKARVRSRVGVTVEGSESKLVAAVQKAVHDLLNPLIPTEAPAVAAGGAPAKTPAKVDTAEKSTPAAPGSTTSKSSTTGVSATASDSRRTWAYVTGGTGAALLVGGAIFGLQAKSAYDAEKKASADGDPAAYDSNKSKAKSMATAADVCFLLGATGVGVGTYLYFTSGKYGRVALDVTPLPGGAFAAISGGF
jgi:TolB-like protein